MAHDAAAQAAQAATLVACTWSLALVATAYQLLVHSSRGSMCGVRSGGAGGASLLGGGGAMKRRRTLWQ
eukprot:4814574-Prymnesium_polylepis.1